MSVRRVASEWLTGSHSGTATSAAAAAALMNTGDDGARLMSALFLCRVSKYFEACQLILKFHRCARSRKINSSLCTSQPVRQPDLDMDVLFRSYHWQTRVIEVSLILLCFSNITRLSVYIKSRHLQCAAWHSLGTGPDSGGIRQGSGPEQLFIFGLLRPVNVRFLKSARFF